MLDEADELFQQDLVRAMRRTLTGLALSEDETGKREWQNRFVTLRTLTSDIYGEDATRALVDQAKKASHDQIDSFMGSLSVALSEAAKEAGA